jgi:hypothetical protein
MSSKEPVPERSAPVLFLLRVAPRQQLKEVEDFDREPPLHRLERLRPSFWQNITFHAGAKWCRIFISQPHPKPLIFSHVQKSR